MAIVKPFKAFRPKKEIAKEVASRPYDVLNSEEARIEANENPYSFLHITKSEIDLPVGIDIHSEIVYQKARTNLQKMIADGLLFQDTKPCYYIYAQTMWKETQYGIVGCAAVEDYLHNNIKKHELTRPDKEEDRKNHIRTTNFNAEPVFLVYPDNKKLDQIVSQYIGKPAEYDFILNDGIGHHFWVIDKHEDIRRIEEVFREDILFTYVADGHHRTAAAAHVGEERKNQNRHHNGNEEYNFFMAVHFPASQLTIIDYNRLVKDLNGLNKVEFLTRLEQNFFVEKKDAIHTNQCIYIIFLCILTENGIL